MSHTVTVTEAIKAAPPLIAGGAWLAGYTINEWAAAAAFVYTCLLIAQTLRRWYVEWRAHRRAKADK